MFFQLRDFAQVMASATSLALKPDFPPPRVVTEWLTRTNRSRAVTRVCEVNYQNPNVALGFLERHPEATFVAIDFGNASRPERTALERSAVASRTRVLPGDGWRSVLAAPQSSWAPGCDVLLIGLREHATSSSELQQRLLQDLPNAMRLASSSTLLVVHGAACAEAAKPLQQPPSSQPSVPVRALKGKAAKAAASANAKASAPMPIEQHWCTYWQALAESRAVLRASCTTASRHGVTWCSGAANTRSLCAARGGVSRGSSARVDDEVGDEGAAGVLRGETWRRDVVDFGRKRSTSVQQWRYFSVLECPVEDGNNASATGRLGRGRGGSGLPRVCLLHKDRSHENMVMAYASADGLHFDLGPPRVVAHKQWPFRVTHNLAMLRVAKPDGAAEYLAVGGQYRQGFKGSNGNHRGLWLLRGPTWHSVPVRGGGDRFGWNARLLFNRSEAQRLGCIERRDPALMPWSTMHPGACEFDGRTSLAHLKGRYFLYARANPASHGQRFVQVTSSSDLVSWSPFRLLRMQGYRYAQGDVYTFAAQASPVDGDSLLAVFPVAHLLQGCICLAASRDGVRWSHPTPVLGCAVNGERTVHHPASTLLLRGDQVHLYVHENVVGITTSMMSAGPTLARYGYLRLPPSRVVRYSIPADRLAAWTRRALAALDAREMAAIDRLEARSSNVDP